MGSSPPCLCPWPPRLPYPPTISCRWRPKAKRCLCRRCPIAIRDLDAATPSFRDDAVAPVLDFYGPKTWTKALLKEKQGEDMWTLLIRQYLLTGNKSDLESFPPYWKHHIVDGRFGLDEDGILRYAQQERA